MGHGILSKASPVPCQRGNNFPQSAVHGLVKVTQHMASSLHDERSVGSL